MQGVLRGITLLGVLAVVWTMGVHPIVAQDLIKIYTQARFKHLAEEFIKEYGQGLTIKPPMVIPHPTDTLLYPKDDATLPVEEETSDSPLIMVDSWRLFKRLERGWFAKEHANTLWAFLGSNTFNSLDTLYTWDLRARLEAVFGPPTQTLADHKTFTDFEREDFVQFEYWFIVNDSIPVVIMDANGPLDRGVVFASDHRYRDLLFTIREALLGQLIETRSRKPYIDYYFNYAQQQWYQTGFDGASFFLKRIYRPNTIRGRPQLSF